MKKRYKILSFLLNTYVISFLITSGILLLLPNYFNKYLLVKDFDPFNTTNNKFFYEDITGDGFSERIILFDNKQFGNKATYQLYSSNGDIVDQYNFNTYHPSVKIAWFQDVNQNGTKEIYILTKSNDSIFLHIHEHIELGNPTKKKIFIDKITGFQGSYEFGYGRNRIFEGGAYDENYVHFSISAGYGGNPRKVYRYNPRNDDIIKSPHLTNSGGISTMVDIDGDGKKEILLNSHASGNSIDSLYTKRSDYSIWLTVLDDNLQFLFKPIEFKGLGGVHTYYPKNKNFLLCIIKSSVHSKLSSRLLKLSLNGKILKEQLIPQGSYGYIYDFEYNTFVLSGKKHGKYLVFNSDLEIVNTFEIDKFNTSYFYDVNKDGKKEWVLFNFTKSIFTIYDFNFKHKVSVQYPNNLKNLHNIGVRYPENGDSQVFLQFDKGLLIYSYKENPYYSVRIVFYVGVYLAILLLTLLITKGQKIREQKKRAIEKEIADLQLKTIKNKVDPHFVFNALNTISEMTLTDNKLEADNFITKYAGFMRKTLAHSDRISTTLKEEINYTKSFIELQQIRYHHSFEYEIDIDKKIDKKLKVPKHILFTYVENAIKYGLANKPKGKLSIDISQIKNTLHITIEDNGWGFRKGHEKSKIGTGNGLKIMNKIFKLYENRYKTNITQNIEEIKENNEVKGVKVSLELKQKK